MAPHTSLIRVSAAAVRKSARNYANDVGPPNAIFTLGVPGYGVGDVRLLEPADLVVA